VLLAGINAFRYSASMNVPGLRSPFVKTGGIFHFARMLDKIRLDAAGTLPPDYHPNLGGGFDERCIDFLQVKYPALVERVKQGGSDEEILEWAFGQSRKPSGEEIEIWNEFMRKRGWNDPGSERLLLRKAESGFPERDDIQTFFDYIDMDEGRDPILKK
jgi:gluconokinase